MVKHFGVVMGVFGLGKAWHLGAILVEHSERMDLFSQVFSQPHQVFDCPFKMQPIFHLCTRH